MKTLINNYLVKERALYRLNEQFVSNVTGDILFFFFFGMPYISTQVNMLQASDLETLVPEWVPKQATFP